MRFELKPITKDGVPAALEKAQRYRFLNDPSAAESICLDVLAVEPENQQAIVMLLLAITDQLGEELSSGVRRAREQLARVRDEYRRCYYAGIVCERYALAQLHHGRPRAAEGAYESLREAMGWFEQAESIRPAGNDESILRWNTCARLLERHPEMGPAAVEAYEPSLE
jgi:hypothetical protein